jgi:hypothetical protein
MQFKHTKSIDPSIIQRYPGFYILITKEPSGTIRVAKECIERLDADDRGGYQLHVKGSSLIYYLPYNVMGRKWAIKYPI